MNLRVGCLNFILGIEKRVQEEYAMSEGKKEQTMQKDVESQNHNKNDEQIILPEVTFSSFVISLSTAALVHLGEMEEPESGVKKKDLLLAKHSIDTLAMLQEKTRGNLEDDEKALLDHILFDLRMKFVQASKAE